MCGKRNFEWRDTGESHGELRTTCRQSDLGSASYTQRVGFGGATIARAAMKSHERPESRLEQSREFLIRCFRKAKKKLRKLFHRRSFGPECVCASQRRNCRALLECIRQEEASMRTNHARQSEGRGWWVFGEMSFRLGTRRNRTTFRSVEMESEVKLPPDDDEDNESFFLLRQLVVAPARGRECGRQTEERNYRAKFFSVFILTNPRNMEISEPSSGTASS